MTGCIRAFLRLFRAAYIAAQSDGPSLVPIYSGKPRGGVVGLRSGLLRWDAFPESARSSSLGVLYGAGSREVQKGPAGALCRPEGGHGTGRAL